MLVDGLRISRVILKTMIASGILLLDKPEGPSSAQVVHRAKKILDAEKVGHLGTLDPFVSGLLLLGVNEGTKVADIFLGASKSYRALMTLGVETDSQDATGEVIATRAVSRIDDECLRGLEQKFTGELEQIPPMFSALKKDGVRLYRLARQGKEIARKPRRITISFLTLKQVSASEIEFDVTCSRGTYVRTLAHDMGQVLGCGAHLHSLRRTACGPLKIEDAVSLEQLAERTGGSGTPLLTLSAALAHLPAVVCDSRALARLRMGQQEILRDFSKPKVAENILRVIDAHDHLVALAEWHVEAGIGIWRLARVFRD